MMLRWSLGLVAVLMAACAVRADEAQAAGEFARGSSLLQAGDFEGALAAYAAAVGQSDNETYRLEHALLRRVVPMRAGLAGERDAKKWDATALALRSYYLDHGLLGEALVLDREAYSRSASADTAARLADTQIRLGEDAAAAETLSGLTEGQHTPQTRVQLGIALAHSGRTEEARKAAEAVPTAEAGPGQLYDLARLRALLGDHAAALALLTQCFESTRPSRLAAFKDYAKADKDLAGVKVLPEFAKALATESKTKESDCSGGASCAKCPSRDKCAGTPKPTPAPKATPAPGTGQ